MDLAKEIGVSKDYLINLSRRSDRHYRSYWQAKKSGGKRQIEVPGKALKPIQKWILKNILESIAVHNCAHGFVKKRSIKTNAKTHLGNSVVLCMDIKNFFPSIKQDMINNILVSNSINKDTTELVCGLTCYKGRLPQGGVCSPYLSNLVMSSFDEKIEGYCLGLDVDYSRYADDLSFSCNDINSLKKVENFIKETFNKTSFKINQKKTRYYTGANRVCVTGINLNKKTELTISSKQKKRLKTMLHHYLVKGYKDNKNEMLGLYRHIIDVQPSYKENLKTYINKLKNNMSKG